MASIRWVRPDFTTVGELVGLAPPATAARCSSAGIRSLTSASVAAMWIALGKTSLRGLRRVDVVVGVHRARPADAVASVAMHLVGVHVRRWCPSRSGRRRSGTGRRDSPAATSSAALTIASATSGGEHARARRWRRGGRLDQAPARRSAPARAARRRSGSSRPPAGSAPGTARAAGPGPRPWCRARCGIRWCRCGVGAGNRGPELAVVFCHGRHASGAHCHGASSRASVSVTSCRAGDDPRSCNHERRG